MKNEQVIEMFLAKENASGSNLLSVNGTLYSYYTPIAQWNGDVILLNTQKYSKTTTTIQNKLVEKIKAGRYYIDCATEKELNENVTIKTAI